MLTFRPNYFIAFIIFLLIEIFIGAFVHDNIIRPYVGDILVVMLLYCLVYAFINIPQNKLLIGITIFSVLVEILQYFKITDKLHVQNQILRIIIGTSFSWIDIICYLIGIGLLWLWFKIVNSVKKV